MVSAKCCSLLFAIALLSSFLALASGKKKGMMITNSRRHLGFRQLFRPPSPVRSPTLNARRAANPPDLPPPASPTPEQPPPPASTSQATPPPPPPY